MPVAFTGDTRNERLQLHVGNRSLFPLHLSVDHFALQCAVPTRLKFAEVLIFLHVDLGEPLDIGHAVPSRHDQSQRGTLMTRQRFAV